MLSNSSVIGMFNIRTVQRMRNKDKTIDLENKQLFVKVGVHKNQVDADLSYL